MANAQLQSIIEMLRAQASSVPPTLEEMRSATETLAAILPLPPDVVCECVDAHGVPAEWISAPGVLPERMVLYLHGGGYVLGSIGTHRALISGIARAARARGLAVSYRLAPEHPFPAAVEDGVAAYRFLLSRGIPPQNIAIAGDSAGGGLAVGVVLALRDAGDPLPAAVVCLSPWLDLTLSGESITARASLDPVVSAVHLQTMAETYLAGADAQNPLASPLFADLKDLPPMLIQVGTAEVLLDDSIRFASAARAAGVDVTLETWDDMVHVWQAFAVALPEGRQAIDRIGEYLDKRFRATP